MNSGFFIRILIFGNDIYILADLNAFMTVWLTFGLVLDVTVCVFVWALGGALGS